MHVYREGNQIADQLANWAIERNVDNGGIRLEDIWHELEHVTKDNGSTYLKCNKVQTRPRQDLVEIFFNWTLVARTVGQRDFNS